MGVKSIDLIDVFFQSRWRTDTRLEASQQIRLFCELLERLPELITTRDDGSPKI